MKIAAIKRDKLTITHSYDQTVHEVLIPELIKEALRANKCSEQADKYLLTLLENKPSRIESYAPNITAIYYNI